MVNRDKIRIMTELARYDRQYGRKNYIINSYFMGDYIGRYTLGSFLSYTFCYVLFMFISVMYRFEEIANEPDITKIVQQLKPYATYYIGGLIIYEVIVITVYIIKYQKGKRQIRVNTAKLKRLKKLQQ